MISAGIKNRKCLTVGEPQTALAMGSGTLPVFATPAMAALMEATASESIESLLEPGTTSVGTKLSLSHLSADPVGETVLCESELTEADGRRFVFRLTVRDRFGIVGEADHERFLVPREKFLEKANAKRIAGKASGHGGIPEVSEVEL